MSSSKKVTVGYKYYLGMHMVLCHGPVDAVTKIEVAEREAWAGTGTSSISINSPELFGGDSREGGISGTVDIMLGTPTQAKNSYLTSVLGLNIPAYRGVVSAVLRQVYIGLNPYLKPWAFWARRINVRSDGSVQWYSAKATINTHDMNPAHIIRECLTDRTWGMGYDESNIDDTSFQSAADTLFSEGFGLSILWDKSSPIDEFIGDILSHIDANLYVNRTTGKFTLALVRANYTLGNLKVFDESNIGKISNFKRSSTSELSNTVTVKYFDILIGKENSVTVQDISLLNQQGTSISTNVSYFGISNGALASKVAARELKAVSQPIAQCTIYADRSAATLNIGDPFVLSWPDYGISQLVMRVVNLELGELTKNQIVIKAVEDLFAMGDAVYAAPPPSSWVYPVNAPGPCPYHIHTEATYYELATQLGDSQASTIPSTSGFIFSSGVRPSSDAINAKLYSSLSGTWQETGTVDFCPTAVTDASVTFTQTVIPITGGIDLDTVNIGTYAYIGTEIIRIDAVSATSITVGRGCIDTTPKQHASGTRIFFIDEYGASNDVEHVTNESSVIRILPSTGLGTLPINSAVSQSLTIVSRHYKPYPPGQFLINGSYYPTSLLNTLKITWAHRNRLQQTGGNIVDITSGSIGPETGTTYNVFVKVGANSTETFNVSGTSFDYPGRSGIILGSHMNGDDNGVVFQDVASNNIAKFGGAKTVTAVKKFGTASAYFDGINSYLEVPASSAFNIGTGSFSIEFWINTTFDATGLATPPRILCSRQTTNGSGAIQVWMGNGSNGTNANAIGLATPAGSGTIASTMDPINDGNWHHVAISRNGTTLRVFLDGVLKQTVTDSTDFTRHASEGFKIGVRPDLNASSFFTGYIDDLRIDKGLSRFTAAFTQPTAEFADTPLSFPVGNYLVELESVRGGVASWQRQAHTVVKS